MRVKRTVVAASPEELCDLMCGGPEEPDHEHCLRCGRRLKSPESRLLGYGETCYKRLTSSELDKPRLF